MYILITVTTLLMLLSIITSTRFEVFLTTMGIRYEYEKYMAEEERHYYNSTETKKYAKQDNKSRDRTKQEGAGPGGSQSEETKKVLACAKLNVKPLFQEKDKSPDYTAFVKQVLIRLIEKTYAHRKFFRGIDPTLFVDRMIAGGKEGGCDGSAFESVNDMAQIRFVDPTMREVYYLMIKGSGPKPEGLEKQSGYYPSLFDFLTYQSGAVPVRLYLAKRPLLLAVLSTPEEADRLRTARSGLLNSYIVSEEGYEIASEADDDCENPPPALSPDDTATLQSAKQSFASGAFSTPFDLKYLDFTVSATKPPND